MALVGFRDESVREKLMVDDNLDWKSLSDALKTRSIARDSSQMLTEFCNLSSSQKVLYHSTMGGVILKLGTLPESWESENTSEDLRRS